MPGAKTAKSGRAVLKKAPPMKVKKGDTVVVLAGKDKGVKGKVIAAFPETHKVVVEGVGRIRKHTKMSMSRRGSQQGGILTQEAPIHVSNVMVVDSDGTATRIGYRHDEDGNKVRTSRRGKKDINS